MWIGGFRSSELLKVSRLLIAIVPTGIWLLFFFYFLFFWVVVDLVAKLGRGGVRGSSISSLVELRHKYFSNLDM